MTPEATDPANSAIESLVEQCLDALHEFGPEGLEKTLEGLGRAEATVRRRIAVLEERGLLVTGHAGPPLLPDHFGRYRVLREIGRGGMGVVFQAELPGLGRRVAIKALLVSQLLMPKARVRFQREIESIARLQHSGIIPIHDFGEESGVPYFVMDYVSGPNLSEIVGEIATWDSSERRGPRLARYLGLAGESNDLTWPQVAADFVGQAAEAVAHAHERGVLHRDIKPSNLMVSDQGRIVVVDFGLAAATESPTLTRTGALLGSLPYMTPEHLRGAASTTDVTTDVYALGVTLRELLTLSSPFADPDPEIVRLRILAADAPSPRRIDPTIPRALESVCLAAMDLNPARRHPSARAFARDIRAARDDRPLSIRPPGPMARALRWSRRHPARITALGMTCLLAFGLPVTVAVVQSRNAADLSKALDETRRWAADSAQQRAAATRAYVRASATIDEVLSRLAFDEKLQGDVAWSQLGNWMLDEAAKAHESLGQGRPDDQNLEVNYLEAGTRLARFAIGLSRIDLARATLERTLDEAQTAAERLGADDRLVTIQLTCLSSLDELFGVLHDTENRLRVGRRRLALCETLMAPESRMRALVDAQEALGRALLQSGHKSESVDFLERALAPRRRLAEASGSPRDQRAAFDLALVLRAAQDPSPVLDLDAATLEEGLRIHDALWQQHPEDPRWTSELARYLRAAGARLAKEGRGDEGLALSRRGLKLEEGLVAAFPRNQRIGESCALAWVGLALQLREREAWGEESEAWLAAAAQFARLQSLDPADLDDRFMTAMTRHSAATALARLGELDQAAVLRARCAGALASILEAGPDGPPQTQDIQQLNADGLVAIIDAIYDEPDRLLRIARRLEAEAGQPGTPDFEATALAAQSSRFLAIAVDAGASPVER
ncbi:MAG: serine/threonine protein kinase [Planctomycetes bacterium]|nr:serine/threonine protein kinase [Planctomycetota bacterium]